MSFRWIVVCVLALVLWGLVPQSAAALPSTGGSGWFWQMPQPHGGWSLTDLDFADADNVWAASGLDWLEGDDALRHSTDGGMTWQAQSVGTPGGLWYVDFVSHDEGWAAGRGLFHTTDGGLTWSVRAFTGIKWFWGMQFLDAQHGWAIGWDTIVRTSDGGATWRRTKPGFDADFISFADAGHGWAVAGGRVFHSRDGGATWHERGNVVAPARLGNREYIDGVYGLSFTDRVHGLVTVLGEDDNGYGLVHIMRTADGGRTWRRAALIRNMFNVGAPVFSPGTLEAWVAACDSPNLTVSGPSVVCHTTDAGLTWDRRAVGGNVQVTEMAVWGDTVCAGGSTILQSSDHGATWLRRTSDWPVTIESIDMTGPSQGWAAGFAGTPHGDDDTFGVVLRSEDGAAWVDRSPPDVEDLSLITALDADIAWAARDVSDGIFHTTDGGLTWSEQPTGRDLWLTRLLFVNANDGWLVGGDDWDGDVCLRTTDGGAMWQSGGLPAKTLVRGICFLDKYHGWITGARRTGRWSEVACTARTTDGGDTWTRQDTTGGYWVGDEYTDGGPVFVDALHGWAVFRKQPGGQHVMSTSDGGVTWVQGARISSSDGISDIDFVDQQNGWVYADRLQRTTDGGVTFETADAGVNWMEADIEAVDAMHLWIAGDFGIVSTVDTAADTSPPATVDDADGVWRNAAVTIRLDGADIGTSGLARTEYRVDGEAAWQVLPASRTVVFPAPFDTHAGDGAHTLAYRSVDNAGNVEFTQVCAADIDTQPPTPQAPLEARARTGERATLKYAIADGCVDCPWAKVTIEIRTTGGRLVKKLGPSRRAVNKALNSRFRCRLVPGTYRFFVSAIDAAGNPQTAVASNRLLVR